MDSPLDRTGESTPTEEHIIKKKNGAVIDLDKIGFLPKKKRMDRQEYSSNKKLEETPISEDSSYGLSEVKENSSEPQVTTAVSPKRWLLLGLFCLYSMSNAYQWIHLNIIADVIKVYYYDSLPGENDDTKSLAIDWLSMVYMLAYIPLIFPATWLLDRKGLRVIGILGTFLNCIGAWLKCASVSSDRFYLLMTAQTICAIAQIFILGMPARIAAVWFGPKQVSTATAIGVFGNQLGVALGFVVPPYLVKLHPLFNMSSDVTSYQVVNVTAAPYINELHGVTQNISDVVANTTVYDLPQTATSLKYMFYSGAGYMTLLFIFVLVVFRKEPTHPPSMAQYKIVQDAASENYTASMVRLIRNGPFMLLVLTYGLNVGVFYAISTLLNPMIFGHFDSKKFPHIAEEAGWIGLTIVIAGLAGSVIAGIWLDRTKLFKITTIIIYALSLCGMLLFTFTLNLQKIYIVFISAGALGMFMTGYLPVGFEFAAELTYPESEGTSSGLLNASAQTFGIVLTLVMGKILRFSGHEQINIRNANIAGCTILLLGGILTIAIKNNLRRQHAETHHEDDSDVDDKNIT